MRLTVRWRNVHREREHTILRVAEVVLFTFGTLALTFCALAWLAAVFLQSNEEREFARNLLVPVAPRVERPIGASRLEVPRLGLTVMVHEGVQRSTLLLGAGHIPGTAVPGDEGNIGIAGHRDSFFRDLRKIRKNDIIVLDTLQGTYEYSVDWTRVVNPTDLGVLAPSKDPVLTLVTCYPFYYVGPAPRRFVVRARKVSSHPWDGMN